MFQENFAIACVAAFVTLVTGSGSPSFLWADLLIPQVVFVHKPALSNQQILSKCRFYE